MAKGFDSPAWGLSKPFFCFRFLFSFRFAGHDAQERMHSMKKSGKKSVIAYRKSCKAMGTGLSHYILMDKKAR
jgi:modified peptide precursor CbpA